MDRALLRVTVAELLSSWKMRLLVDLEGREGPSKLRPERETSLARTRWSSLLAHASPGDLPRPPAWPPRGRREVDAMMACTSYCAPPTPVLPRFTPAHYALPRARVRPPMCCSTPPPPMPRGAAPWSPYLAPTLSIGDRDDYAAAGLLAYRVADCGRIDVLLGRQMARGKGPSRRGTWSFIGGKREPIETCSISTASREASEESMLSAEAMHSKFANNSFTFDFGGLDLFFGGLEKMIGSLCWLTF